MLLVHSVVKIKPVAGQLLLVVGPRITEEQQVVFLASRLEGLVPEPRPHSAVK